MMAGLFGLALIAGTIDTMAGGGGLLTLPGLMMTGLSPVAVLATSKAQAVFGPLSASVHFWREGVLDLRRNLLPAVASFLGAFGGAATVSSVDPQALKTLVPYLLIVIALWLLLSPKLGEVERKARIPAHVFSLIYVPVIGFYDGFIGPGTGTFFALGAVSLLGATLQDATVRAKLYNFASNLGALAFWIFSGHIVWVYALIMAAGMFLGGAIGARLVLKHGTALIRPLLVAVSLAMSLKLLLS
jgi:uncharacterized membrane protein YfcA